MCGISEADEEEMHEKSTAWAKLLTVMDAVLAFLLC